jgi:DNA-binding response OmpR family regulator
MIATILIVDDDPQIRSFVALALEDEGYQALWASDGDSLELARTKQPDLILLDVLMPVMDGVEVSRHLRAHATTRTIPIVAMSAHRTRGDTPGMLADDWLAKPFDLDQLYVMVARWVGRRSAARR